MARSQDLSYITEALVPIILGTKQRRKYIESEWLLNYRAWQGWPTQAIPLPDGGIHYFIPHARRAIEKNVKRITKLLMPNTDRFQTLPRDGISHEHAEATHAVMQYIYSEKIATKRLISTAARFLQLYNIACVSTSVQIENDLVWPYQETKDPFSFYVFPDTALNRQEALVLHEECIIPYQVYKSFSDANPEIYEPLKLEELITPEWPYHLVERLAYRGLTNPSDFSQGTGNIPRYTEQDLKKAIKETEDSLVKQSRAFVCLEKVYFRVSSSWFYTVICMNTHTPRVVRLDDVENQPLYRWTNTRPLPGELYTNSEMDDMRVLQNLCNTAISQVEANRTKIAEPDIAVDMNELGRIEHFTFQNRQIWRMPGNPKDLIQEVPVGNTIKEGLTTWQVYKQLIDQGSGGAMTEGNPGRNMPRSGNASTQLLNIALIDIEDVADTQEQELLTPALADTYHIILEYVPEKQLFQIPAKNINLIKQFYKRDITGNYSFTWLGSLGWQDNQVRAQKFNEFLALILNPTALQVILPQLQQQQQTIDFAGLLRTAYTFGLGERGLSDIIIPMTPEQIQLAQEAAQRPDPKLQIEQAKLELEGQKAQADIQLKQAEMESKQQLAQADLQGKQLDIQGKVIEIRGKQQLASMDQESKRMDQEGKRFDLANKALGSLKGDRKNA